MIRIIGCDHGDFDLSTILFRLIISDMKNSAVLRNYRIFGNYFLSASLLQLAIDFATENEKNFHVQV